MDNIINEYYEKYNFPAVQRLYKLLKQDGHKITTKDIQSFLNKQKEYEMLKVKQTKKKKLQGHITAITYKENAQLDIYDLSKYESKNKGYKYMLALIDVFTRKAFIRPMKNKNISDVLLNLKDIFITDDYIPHVITSDTDKTFMSAEVQKLFQKYDIFHDAIIAGNDHRVLGIIDRLALTLKMIFSKIFIRYEKAVWINHIKNVIEQYNNSPHSSLDGLTPNDATKLQYQHDVASINRSKISNKKVVSLFKVGDNVRIRLTQGFRKGTEPRYTDNVYQVVSVDGQRVTLNNNKTYIDSDVIITYTTDTQSNVIEEINKTSRHARRKKKAGVSDINVVTEKRQRKPNSKYITD
jgi:hypothetical protein